MALTKTYTITSDGEEVEKSEAFYNADRNTKSTVIIENILAVTPKIKELSYDPGKFTPRYISSSFENKDSYRYLNTEAYFLLLIAKKWKQPKYQFTDERINKTNKSSYSNSSGN